MHAPMRDSEDCGRNRLSSGLGVGPRWSVGVHLAKNNATGIFNVGDDPEAMEWH